MSGKSVRLAVRPAAKVALVCRTDCEAIAEKAAAPPATPRHPNHSLPLLPSGPGGVCELSSRGDRRGHHRRGLLSPETDGLDPLGTLQVGGESGIRTRDTYYRIHTFQACSFNHSDTSPLATNNYTTTWMRGIVRLILSLTPRCREGPACGCPNLFQTNLSNPRYVLPYTHFPGVLLQPLGHLSAWVKPPLPVKQPRQRSGRIAAGSDTGKLIQPASTRGTAGSASATRPSVAAMR
jgi:hypothetical protein